MTETFPPYTNLPPPAPPLPPARLGPLQRFIAPLGFNKTGRQASQRPQPTRPPTQHVSRSSYGVLPSQTAAHRTGIPIAALDVNQQKTHAILAGKEILKTVRVHDSKVTEEFNVRSSIVHYASTHGSPQGDSITRRREYLPARDVKWSVGKYDHIIATAAANGRISLYDVNAAGSRTEVAWLHEHQGQVNKLDIDPFSGYLLLSASQDKTVRLWDIREPKSTKCKQRFEIRTGVREVRWSPKEGNDFEFAVCADGGIIQHWDARNPLGPRLSINAHERGCYSLDWHPDGRHVVSGGFDKYVRVWDFKSDNRRQKPTYQFRAPQAIRIVRWRPTTAAEAEGPVHHTAQIATTYHYDDPRIHLWDFRRPLLPFRELDTYNSPANDFLWASKDQLWTVGDQGMFTQNDVRFAPQVHESLPPSAVDWMPDGQCAMFMEERAPHRTPELSDPVAGFLNVPHEKLSGEEPSMTQPFELDEEITNESLLSTSFRRRQSKAMSSRSAQSQGNSPPIGENFIQQLDMTMLASKHVIHDEQTGVVVTVEGASAEPEVVEFLARYYSSLATESERKASPSLILQRLESCFINNADVCDKASLHRMAQSWRMLAAVIVPELKEWAENNRKTRRAEAAKKRQKDADLKELRNTALTSPFAKIAAQDFQPRADKEAKPVSVFRGLKDSKNGDHYSSSNMTTPLARPVTDSPRRAVHRSKVSDESSGDMDSLQGLPPSLLNSHSTASAAAKALREDTSLQDVSPRSRTRQTESMDISSSDPRAIDRPASDSSALRPKKPDARHQEEQRAALRDYRAQPRPIFNLEAPVKNVAAGAPVTGDSAESFPMFPASTSSSHRDKAFESFESFESPDRPSKGSTKEDKWLSRENSGLSELSMELSSPSRDPKQSGFYGSNDFASGGDGLSESKEDFPKNPDSQTRAATFEEGHTSIPNSAVISSSPEMFHFDPSLSPPKPKIHSINPASKQATVNSKASTKIAAAAAPPIVVNVEEMETEDYILTDFRPIDLSGYHPRLPFAWSALPLVCQMVAFDMDNGIAAAQFATHLLLHVAPYFFSERSDTTLPSRWPESVAERLMVPALSHRIIEALLLKHTTFLRRMHLFECSAEIRKLCAELGYERINAASAHTDGKDTYAVASVCSYCQTTMEIGKNACSHCAKAQPPCPICLSASLQPQDATAHPSQLWAFCQACGHSAHNSCMQDWLSQPYAEGSCPTTGCSCDCGPGSVRQSRIESQIKAYEESKLIRGTTQSTKKDPVKATQSPAVDKTRAVLRAASGDRGTQSSDERSMPTRKGSQRGRARPSVSGLGSRKSVRLITPGEESR